MAKQFRPAMEQITLEFPAGEISPGESPIMAATREVHEEIDVESNLLPLGSYSLMMNRTKIKNFLFLGLVTSTNYRTKSEFGIQSIEIGRKKFKKLVSPYFYALVS